MTTPTEKIGSTNPEASPMTKFPGPVLLVVLDRNHDTDARILAQRNMPRPAPVAERGDEGHRRALRYLRERAHHSPGAAVARVGEISPQRDEANIGNEPSGAELLRDERGLSRGIDQEAAAHGAVFPG